MSEKISDLIEEERWNELVAKIKSDQSLINDVIESGDYAGFTPLAAAVMNGQKSVVEQLISLKANVNHVIETEFFAGASVLHIAALSDNFDGEQSIARLLIEHGADQNFRPTFGQFSGVSAQESWEQSRNQSTAIEVGSIDDKWVSQKDPSSVKIYDTPQEWELIMLYLAKHAGDYSNPFKVNRHLLELFLAENPDITIPKEAIRHSFFVVPGNNPGDFRLLMMARSKVYTDGETEYTEGILGHGAFGRVNPCLVRNVSSGILSEDKPGIFAIKTQGASESALRSTQTDDDQEVMIMKLLGRDTVSFVRDRSTDSSKDIQERKAWIQGNDIGLAKEYIIQPIIQGVEPTKGDLEVISKLDKLRYALALTQAVKELHDKNIIHRDLKEGNLVIMKSEDSSSPRSYVGMSIDFGTALILESSDAEVQGKRLEGTMAYMAPEVKEQIIFSKKSDIYALGITFQRLGLSEVLENVVQSMLDENRHKRPDAGDIMLRINSEIALESKEKAGFVPGYKKRGQEELPPFKENEKTDEITPKRKGVHRRKE